LKFAGIAKFAKFANFAIPAKCTKKPGRTGQGESDSDN